ncbi:MAG: hypothetical protein NVSMB7_14220 [Chitinophagaceae bacterium]
MLIFEELNKWKLTIRESKISVNIILTEYDKTILAKKLDSMEESANFLFLDQNGIKQITSRM